MRIRYPAISSSPVFLTSSQELTATTNVSGSTLHGNTSGMGSVPVFADIARNKNGVSNPQLRPDSPAVQQPLLGKKWASDGIQSSVADAHLLAASKHSQNMVTLSSSQIASSKNHHEELVSTSLSMNTTLGTKAAGGAIPASVSKIAQSNLPAQTVLSRPAVANSAVTSSSKQTVRISSAQPVLVQGSPQISIPPGMMLARNQTGQLLLVSNNTLPNAQGGDSNLPVTQPHTSSAPVSIKTATPVTVAVSLSQNQAVTQSSGAVSTIVLDKLQVTSQASTAQSSQSIVLSQEDVVNVSKCRNFLTTLIKLASAGGQSATTVNNVKKLVQDLIDDKIQPEHFTQQLQIELNSAPQPYLVPFLKRSLPLLRLTMMQQSGGSTVPPAVAMAALRASTATTVATTTVVPGTAPTSKSVAQVQKKTPAKVKVYGKKNSVPDIRLPRVASSNQLTGMRISSPSQMSTFPATNAASGVTSSPRSSGNRAWGMTPGAVGTFKDEDDINDVASMAGVNLSEESARILATNSELIGSQVHSCKDVAVVNTAALRRRITEIVTRHSHVNQIDPGVIKFTACATEAKIKDLIEKVSLVAFHRTTSFREDDNYEGSQDIKMQLKFLLQLDQLEKKRHADCEREVLMRAMKSRSKNEDPEQLRLKQRAKEMQQLEMERLQIRNADETARNAIGPRRKKAKLDVPGSGSSVESKDFSSPRSSILRPRVKRVNTKDLVFILEQEKDMSKSKLLYKYYLK